MTRTGQKHCDLGGQDVEKLKAVVAATPIRPFLVTLDRSRSRLMVHIAKEAAGTASGPAAHLIRHRLSELGVPLSIEVKLHSGKALDRPRSLEAFVSKFRAGEQLFDPTGAFTQAGRLIELTREIRRRLEGDLAGIYWSSRWRTLYVLLNEESFRNGYFFQREKLIEAERAILGAHAAESQAVGWRNVRLCFGLPGIPLVPLDEASLVRQGRSVWRNRLLRVAGLAKVPTLSALLGIGTVGIAAAKVPSVGDTPVLSSEHITKTISASAGAAPGDQFPGGPGLHMLWRDPIEGAVGRNASFDRAAADAQAPARTAAVSHYDERGVSRDQFLQVANSGSTFGAETAGRQIDLSWLPQRDRATKGEAGQSSNDRPAMRRGLAAVPGLIGRNLSDQDYRTGFDDVQAHFGLPRSLQAEAHWHFVNTPESSTASTQGQGGGYWEWLRRIDRAAESVSGHSFDQLAASKPKPKPRRRSGSSV